MSEWVNKMCGRVGTGRLVGSPEGMCVGRYI